MILSPCSFAQGLRITYIHQYKNDPEADGYKTEMDMTVDFNGTRSAFYSENTYLRDSLRMIAFDTSGNIIDEDIYGQIVRMSGRSSKDILFMDFASSSFRQTHRIATHCLAGRGTIQTPEWETIGDGETIEGYKTKKAQAEYMGRKWTIWYTEEIPASTGPWLLYGAPGLIVKARDSENLFLFRMRYIEMMNSNDNRYVRLDDILKRDLKTSSGVVYTGNIKEAERIYHKFCTDLDYTYKSAGITQITVDGQKLAQTYQKHIPIIPIE